MKQVEASPGSIESLMADVRYGIVFGEMNEAFNNHIHHTFSFVWIFCASLGTTTFAGGSLLAWLGKFGYEYVAIASILLGGASAAARSMQKAYKFNERAAQFRKTKIEFQRLETKGWSMSIENLRSAIGKLQEKAPIGGSWVAPLAYNKACEELGYPEVKMPVPARTKIVWNVSGEWA